MQAGNELDELLQSLAGQNRGTIFCRTPLTANEPLHNELGIESYPGDVSLPPHANCLSVRMTFIKRSTCRRRIHLEAMLDWCRALVQASASLRRVVC